MVKPHEKPTKREQTILNSCPIKKVTVSYNAPFRGRPTNDWKEINLKENNIVNPEVCKGGDELWFRRSTIGKKARFYVHKSFRND